MGWMTQGSISSRGWNFFFTHHVQADSGAHPAFYPLGTKGKAAGA